MKRLSLLLLLVLFSCTKDPVMYDVTVSATEGGTVSPQSGTFEEGSSVTFTATPSAEYEFTKWSNGSTQNPLVLTVTSDLTIQATFTKKQYELTISKEGEGTVSEKVINAGKGYGSGTKVELTAVPAGEWVFAGWSGDVTSNDNPLQVTISSPKNIKATFKKIEYSLDITIIGNGQIVQSIKSITGSGVLINLTALAEECWEFKNWSGIENANNNSIELMLGLSEEKTIEVEFIEKEKRNADKLQSLENIKIPKNFDYNPLASLSHEAKEKLNKIKPSTLSQASRISGIKPSDISVLLVKMGR